MQLLAFCSLCLAFGETKARRQLDPLLLTQSVPVPAALDQPSIAIDLYEALAASFMFYVTGSPEQGHRGVQ